MKRFRIIEYPEYGKAVCDNPQCDYIVVVQVSKMHLYVNKPCPECGDNLLTQQDYDNFMALLRFVIFINRWFGWLAFFFKGDDKPATKTAHFKKGSISITDKTHRDENRKSK